MTPSPAAPTPGWRTARRLAIALPLALAIVPPLLLARAMARDAVDLPWMDQWTFAREVVRVHDGQFAAAQLWAQHNEHRVPVPKLVLHALAAASGWDVRWEVGANFVVALAMIALVASTIHRTIGPVAPVAVGPLVLAAAAIQSSLVQWQNWTWGWQLGLLLAEAGAVLVAASLARAASAPTRWAVVAMLAAVAAALSNGVGLVLLGVAPLGLVALRAAGARPPLSVVLACLGTGVATGGLYAVGWTPAFGQPKATPVAGHAAALTHYALTFLGGPVASWDTALAWRWGVTAIATVLLCTAFVWTAAPAQRPSLVPWLALVAFAAGAAALTAVGRLGAGMHTALISRYATFAVPLWLAVGPLIVLAIATVRPRTLRAALVAALLPVLGLALVHGRRSWTLGDQRMAQRAGVARRAAECIADPADAPDRCYRAICWNARFARESALQLAIRRLGPWAHDPE